MTHLVGDIEHGPAGLSGVQRLGGGLFEDVEVEIGLDYSGLEWRVVDWIVVDCSGL